MTSNDTPACASRADVTTDRPARYAKQLVSHLGRKLDVTTQGATSTAAVGAGTGQVVVGDGVLTLLATAPDGESVATIEHVLGSHLLRFATRGDLTVAWTPTTSQAPPA